MVVKIAIICVLMADLTPQHGEENGCYDNFKFERYEG